MDAQGESPTPVTQDRLGAARRGTAPAADDVILYDGICGLCTGVVRFVLPRDRGRRFRFAPLQSAFARQVLARHGRAADALDTMALVEGLGSPAEVLRVKSDAALRLFAALGGAWALVAVLRIVPRFLRDAVYDLVARVRYRLFGKRGACLVPPAEDADRFIEA